MTNLDNLARWQATMDMAVYKFEKRTGLKLAGLSPPEISQRIKEWTSANKSSDRPAPELNNKGLSGVGNGLETNSVPRKYVSLSSSIAS